MKTWDNDMTFICVCWAWGEYSMGPEKSKPILAYANHCFGVFVFQSF